MQLLRDDPAAVSVVDGYIVISAFPVVEAALVELQDVGLIPAGIQIPDLSSPEAPDVLAQRLESVLGITLPDGFGTIQLMKADRLLAARSAVRAFDLIVVGLLILTVLLIVLAVWLATHRLRMVIYLGLGTIVAFVLARLAIGAIENAALAGVADADLIGAIRAVVDVTLADLRRITAVVLIGTVVLVVVAGVGVFRSSGATIPRDRASIERIGLVAIAFVVIWLAVGPEIALLGVALVAGLELIARALSSGSADDATPTAEA